MRKFVQLFAAFWRRIGRPAVAALLGALIVAAGVVDSRATQISALLALSVIIMETLFSIERHVYREPPAAWFAQYHEGVAFAVAEIVRRLTAGAEVEVRWLGVTHDTGWPVTQNLLERTLAQEFGSRARLRVSLATLSPGGRIVSLASGPPKSAIKNSHSLINDYVSHKKLQLEVRKCSIELITYDFRPTWHGLMVDDDFLLYSTCRPTNLGLSSPQGGAEVVRRDGSGGAAERISHFADWFDEIAAHHARAEPLT